ncbi:MAG TPA: ferrochelatase [Stellaceae bacterium]|jgi:ferrochelatase
MTRTAVVLMNLGGPDSLDAVEPFLFNLFSDPAIIRLPMLLRLPLARLAARGRAKAARAIYARLGGGSPLLANTEAQARALEAALGSGHRAFVAMRYWHPMSAQTASAVAEWAPDEIVCLPLYPQFSTTTTASSLAAWRCAAARAGVDRPTRAVCCYPAESGFVEAVAGLIRPVLAENTGGAAPLRLLLTAHGLPKRIVRAGDSYPDQVETTARAVVGALGEPGLDWRLCYQSRVGPLEWIGPSVDDEIRRAGADRVALVLAPISFVSEHSETLVELDHDYRNLAERSGVPGYRRVAAVGVEPRFIAALAALVRNARPLSRAATRMAGRGCRFGAGR